MCTAEPASSPPSAVEVTAVEVTDLENTKLPYSEDEPPPEPEEVAKLKWRLDPDETFSDWKIELVTVAPGTDSDSDDGEERKEEGDVAQPKTVTTYHVHKCHLAVGNRRSEYFARLFKSSGDFKESQDQTSRIELDPLAAASFPQLLDYVYAPDGPLEINTQTATALHHLGEYFEMRNLRWDAKRFCQNDISLDNVDTYYQHGTLFHNETILSITADFLGRNIANVSLDLPIVQNTDPELWVQATQSVDPAHTSHWSEIVNRVGHIHMNDLDKETFQNLTVPSAMPQVDAQVALDMVELEDRLDDLCDEFVDEDDLVETMTSLQERCTTSLSQIWQELETKSYDQDFLTNLQRRKPIFLVDLLVKCLQESRGEVREARQALAKTQAVLRRFKPLKEGDYQQGSGTAPVPQELADLNPEELVAGTACQQHQHAGITHWQSCPVFYYAANDQEL